MGKKPRIVIVGAGMAGLTAAKKLYTARGAGDMFELCVVEGGSRIGGRINTSDFCGERIEMGATWIHGIGGSPVHKIAEETGSLVSDQPWECMDGASEPPRTFAEGGFEIEPSEVDKVSKLFNSLMSFAQTPNVEAKCGDFCDQVSSDFRKVKTRVSAQLAGGCNGVGKTSVGSFLKQGFDAYWESVRNREEVGKYGNWTRKQLQEAIFAMHSNTQRTYTSADDLERLDFAAESEYQMFPGEEITIAKGYLAVIEHLASFLPPGLIQLNRRVTKIEWLPEATRLKNPEKGCEPRPVKLSFLDGSAVLADHVILTVSLGVLKAGIGKDSGLFDPPLPSFKAEAIQRLGFGVVNKLFVEMSQEKSIQSFPCLQMVFHRPDSEFRDKKIPWWMRKTARLSPIHANSRVLLAWFAGKEALELESLSEEEIINGVSSTVASLMGSSATRSEKNSNEVCNGDDESGSRRRFTRVLKSRWCSDPLFQGSYSYVSVESNGDDLDKMAEPLPKTRESCDCESHKLQILFAGEATHRTHYSTTHGAYFSGLREANRLLHYYQCPGA